MKKGFLTVEVLISLVIITMGVLMSMSALKTFNTTLTKKEFYEDASIALLSINDTLGAIDFDTTKHLEGNINGINYTIDANRLATQRTYIYGDTVQDSSFSGPFEIYLYQLNLHVFKETFSKSYVLYQTRYKKIVQDNDEEF